MPTRLETRFAKLKAEGRGGLVTFVTAGDPDAETSLAILKALPAAGAAAFERAPPAQRLDGRPMSLDEAVDAAQRRYNARVVRAEVEDRGGRRVYVLRLLSSDGRVFNVRVDAATGSMQ